MKYVLIFWGCIFFGEVQAQIDTLFHRNSISFSVYLDSVTRNNLQYAAQKFNVPIAEAGKELARVFPNPSLTYGYFDNGQRRLSTGYGYIINLAAPIELGGKRKARIQLASSQTELTQRLLEDYFRNLRADATLSYLAAIKERNILKVTFQTYQTVKRLAQSDSIRFLLGSITEIDARQSKIEAASLRNTLYQSDANWKASLVNLNLWMGHHAGDTLSLPSSSFGDFARNFTLNDLMVTAKNNRADLLAALKNKEVAKRAWLLTKANRAIDLGIVVGSNNSSVISNYVEPTPSITQFNAGISIPLKFSNNYKGDLHIAEYNMEVAELQYRQAELEVEMQVQQAFYYYQSARRQVTDFTSGLLFEAKKVLEGRTYSYQRGKTSLLEVLAASRTYNTIQQNYFETLYNYAAALVELERSVGIWDVTF